MSNNNNNKNTALVLPEDLLDEMTASRDNKYTVEDKVEICTLWIMGETSRSLEKKLGVPSPTIRYWMQRPWWAELKAHIRKAKNEELDAKLSKVIHTAVNELQDRVENGNIKMDPKTGELRRIPLSSSELAKDGLGIPYDKRALTRGDPTNRTASQGGSSQEETLKQLAEAFLKIAQENQPTKVIEAERVDSTQFTTDE